MYRVKTYLNRVRRSVFHRGERLALEGGIFFGPGTDPKGTFYGHPKLAIYWNQPASEAAVDGADEGRGLLNSWFSKLGGKNR